MSAEWDIGKLFFCKKDIFTLPTQQLAKEEYAMCKSNEVPFCLTYFIEQCGNEVYHIPAGKPFMILYGEDGSQVVKVLYEDKIGWIDFNSLMFERWTNND